MGATIQCTNCYAAYHPLCARMAGLHMEMADGGGIPGAGPLTIKSYCPRHCRPQPHLSGMSLSLHVCVWMSSIALLYRLYMGGGRRGWYPGCRTSHNPTTPATAGRSRTPQCARAHVCVCVCVCLVGCNSCSRLMCAWLSRLGGGLHHPADLLAPPPYSWPAIG